MSIDVACEIDEFQHGAIWIAEIDARAVHHAALPVFLADDLDMVPPQALDGGVKSVGCDGEGMMHAFGLLHDRIDRMGLLDENEANAASVNEGEMALGGRGEMLASDDLGVEGQAFASDSVALATVIDAVKIRYKVNDCI